MFVSPMLLEPAIEPFDSDDYITEIKFDGIRIILSKSNNTVRLYTRHGNEVTSKFPELLTVDIPDGTVLDGEVIVPDVNGASDFDAVMQRFQSNKATHNIVYCVFDIFKIDGESITFEPLFKRKESLKGLQFNHPNIFLVEGMRGNGVVYFYAAKEKRLEGIVLKKADSPYEINKRSKNWLKIVNYEYTDVLIIGLRKKDHALLLSYPDGQHAGIMEFMANADRRRLHAEKKIISESDNYTYINPLSCIVKHRFKTKHGLLRLPSFHKWN
ncbi:ATP-dependent DNA ligase [Bacillus swezeyi]|uniref:ATP-dependent DNA ligase n=1 Tax=Bacillus swezeyi TaxID=1925020 RepID=A0A5M8RGC8_9BACI|nr:RNA ligase family protein [Bacillus swezeyi]KAA6446901.1 ATP-dependent DNA ligase [Bacillus swezeyi]KAA6471469.1 ATP-dependent DNA ligase [Bacillus swezeyi]